MEYKVTIKDRRAHEESLITVESNEEPSSFSLETLREETLVHVRYRVGF